MPTCSASASARRSTSCSRCPPPDGSARRAAVVRRLAGRSRRTDWVRALLSDNIGRMDAITMPPAPINEPNLTYAPGSAERDALAAELLRQEATEHPMDAYIGGEWVAG